MYYSNHLLQPVPCFGAEFFSVKDHVHVINTWWILCVESSYPAPLWFPQNVSVNVSLPLHSTALGHSDITGPSVIIIIIEGSRTVLFQRTLTICRWRCACRSLVFRVNQSLPGPCPVLFHHGHPCHPHALVVACHWKAWWTKKKGFTWASPKG